MDSIQDKLIEQFQNMDNAYEAYAKSKGLTYLSLMVLDEIYALGDGCTQKQISEDTHYPKQSINLVVKSFLEDGIVELRELPENRKNKGITLTEKGRQLCDDVIVPLLRQEEAAMLEMGEKESADLLRLVELYGNAYCKLIKKNSVRPQSDIPTAPNAENRHWGLLFTVPPGGLSFAGRSSPRQRRSYSLRNTAAPVRF